MASRWRSKRPTGSRPLSLCTTFQARARCDGSRSRATTACQSGLADGKRVAFQSDREGDRAIFWQPVGGGTAERLTRPEPRDVPRAGVVVAARRPVLVQRDERQRIRDFAVDVLASRSKGVAVRRRDVKRSCQPTRSFRRTDDGWHIKSARQERQRRPPTSSPFLPPEPSSKSAAAGALCGRATARSCFSCRRRASSGQFRCGRIRRSGSALAVSIPRRFGLAAPASPRPYDILPDGRIVAVDAANPAGDQTSQQLQVVLNWYARNVEGRGNYRVSK